MATEFLKIFLLPSSLMALFALAGAICLAFRKARRVAAWLFCAAGLLFLVFANGPVSHSLVRQLEDRYPAFSATRYPREFKQIVVLTGHALPDARLPASSTVNSASAFRILEALRLQQLFPDARIIISGSEDVPLLMQRLLLSLGVKKEQIAVETKSQSTFESALHLRDQLKEHEFILVTSAGHMPRSMAAFRQAGLSPIPAPTDHLAKMDPFDGNYWPNARNLMRADLALHEYCGLLWYWITGLL
jgi:uncharacterized SAM-binding protein YcdF (DUF218 family)